jgi:hypothetical protein
MLTPEPVLRHPLGQRPGRGRFPFDLHRWPQPRSARPMRAAVPMLRPEHPGGGVDGRSSLGTRGERREREGCRDRSGGSSILRGDRRVRRQLSRGATDPDITLITDGSPIRTALQVPGPPNGARGTQNGFAVSLHADG